MDQTTTAHAIAATAISVFGVAVGLSYEVLVAGFFGGLVSLSFLPVMSIWGRLWTLVTSTLTAGYSAPFGAHLLSVTCECDGLGKIGLLVTSAFWIGVLAQVIIPIIMRLTSRRLANYEGSKL